MTDIKKFREAGIAALEIVESEHVDRARALIMEPDWGGEVCEHSGGDYITISVPGEIRDTLIFDSNRGGIKGLQIANAMIKVARYQSEAETRQTIRESNVGITNAARNMMTYLTYPSVNVAPSETRAGFVRLNGWGEFDRKGLKVVYEALKATDEAIKNEVHR